MTTPTPTARYAAEVARAASRRAEHLRACPRCLQATADAIRSPRPLTTRCPDGAALERAWRAL